MDHTISTDLPLWSILTPHSSRPFHISSSSPSYLPFIPFIPLTPYPYPYPSASLMTFTHLFLFPLLFTLPLIFSLPNPTPIPSPTATRGVVNGYCTGSTTVDPCPLSVLSNYSSIINAVSINSYKISDAGHLEPCSPDTPGCTWAPDVEEYNRNITLLPLSPPMQVIPLVFDNDGNTIKGFRAMMAGNLSGANIAYLTAAAVKFNYSAINMDWEPSCWQSKPSQCQWPTPAEAMAYVDFLRQLAQSLHSVGRPLTVCANHDECGNCAGYDKLCSSDQMSMGSCNCCAFQTWFNATALCAASEIDTISVMDTYGSFYAQQMDMAVATWTKAGCAASRLSLGLLQDEVTTAKGATQMMEEVRKVGASRVDIWSNPWTTSTLIGVWDDALRAFINGTARGDVDTSADRMELVRMARGRKRGQ